MVRECYPMSAAREPLNAVNLRLPKHMIDRADALRAFAERAPELAVLPSVSRSDVLRLALLRGLEHLEAEFEAIVDEELACEADRRLTDPDDRERVPWAEVRAERAR